MYFINSKNNQNYVTQNCENSTCTLSASSLVLEGQANDLVNVSVNYMSNTYNQSQNFSISLRGCVTGEIYNALNKICTYCQSGTYSLSLSDASCQDCPIGAICYGGENITINPGYYRSMANTSVLLIVPCNDSDSQCLGGNLQTNCSETYTGVICSQCNQENGYLSSGKDGECNICYGENKLITFSILLIIGSILFRAYQKFVEPLLQKPYERLSI